MPSTSAGTNSPCACATERGKRKAVNVDPEIRASNLKRLRRIEGQVRGLQKMVEANRYCADIMVQVASVQEALRAVAQALMRNHLRHCATESIKKGTEKEVEAMYEEILNLVFRYSR